MGTHVAQRVDERSDGTVLHAFRSRQHVRLPLECTQIGRHEAHGRSSGTDVDHLWHVAQGIDDNGCVVTVAQVLRQLDSPKYGLDDERPVADAFRGRKMDGCIEFLRPIQFKLFWFYVHVYSDFVC